MNNNDIVRKNLQNLRKVHGLTAKNFASKIGISFQQVQKYESGANAFLGRLLEILAAFKELGCEDPLKELFKGTDFEIVSFEEKLIDAIANSVADQNLIYNLLKSNNNNF